MSRYAKKNYKAEVLAAMPGTVTAMMKVTGLGRACVYYWLAILHKEENAHIGARKRTPGQPATIWHAGPGVDAPPLPPMGCAEYNRRHRKRRAKEEKPFIEARAESLACAEKTIKRGDPYTSCLMACLVKKPAQVREAANG